MSSAKDAERLQRLGRSNLGLDISDALLARTLAFLDQHERAHAQRLMRGYRVALGKQRDSKRIRSARKEAAAVRNASAALHDLLKTDRAPSGMDWAFELRSNCIVSSLHSPVLGSELELDDWRQQVTRLLETFVELADMRASYFGKGALPFEAKLPKEVEAAFAQGLACLFVIAGGRLGATGKAGFPAYLKLVWPLVPNIRGERKDSKFADDLARMVTKSFKDQLEDPARTYSHTLAAARAGYTLDLINGWRS